ncbi:hypothetical protein [Gemmatirosa kalamazoonensis]|nr:hypothetical protein [Gemmatirosa kalamazoonensis]
MNDLLASPARDTAMGPTDGRMLASISSITGASRLAELSQFA